MSDTIRNILIVKLSALGDLAHALPVAGALRRAYPEAHLAWVVESRFRELLAGHPDLNEVIAIPLQKRRGSWTWSNLRAMVRGIRELRRRSFDLVIDLQGLLKSGLVTGLSGAPRRLGFHRRDCREPLSALFTNQQAPPTGHLPHIVQKNLALLRALGVDPGEPRFSLYIPEQAEAYIGRWLASERIDPAHPLVALHPAVGYPTKAWPLDRFAALGDRVSRELGARVILTWGPGDRDLARAVGDLMREPYHLGPETPSLKQALALYRRLRLLISGDTGPLHLCAALDVPTVSIYGPTDPARNGPFGPRHRVLVEPQPCSFCFKRTCPFHQECMDAVTVDQVFEAVRQSDFGRPVGAGHPEN